MRTVALVAMMVPTLLGAQRGASANWPQYGGTPENNHYSTLSQITPQNVSRLQVAWTYDTKDEFPRSEMQANPIVIDGVLYAESPKLRVFALDAATAKELWSFDPTGGRGSTQRFRHRGVTVTGDRVLATYRNFIWALDRKTGKPILSFGDSGRVDMRNAFDRPATSITISASTPGVVHNGLFIIGSSVPEALPSAPGDLRAYDVKTGALKWVFHTIPRPGEDGYETWPPDAWKVSGGANAWAGVTVDPLRGIVFAATGSASFDFYGANRHGDNLYANTVLAIDARTGRKLWHFQTIKHDLWDWDLPTAPTLVNVVRDGRRVDAVAQVSKIGFVYLLDRVRGTSLFPIEYRPVGASSIEGERAADAQPFPTKPPPFTRQYLDSSILTTRTPAAHASALADFRAFGTRGLFDPPRLPGTIVYPGFDGGGEWGGPAFDPETALLYVNSNDMPWLLKMAADTTATATSLMKYRTTVNIPWADPDGYPAITPPWGTLNAIDLNAGTIKWQIPFGEYPALAAQGVPTTGTDSYGGAIVTQNGLLIIGATTYDKKLRVFDKATGKLLWETTLPASGNATPSTYMVNGRQYIVIACGGGKNGAESGGKYVAFALPR
jgi:quinoprotein glucose dehydrogenase